jgi:MinD superfamily P-loop ATPase
MAAIKQLCIISGKGGTGKTTVAASLAALMPQNKVLADCDVDASNLPLVLRGREIEIEPFTGGLLAHIDQGKCTRCGACLSACRFEAVTVKDGTYGIHAITCEGCKVCAYVCAEGAIAMKEMDSGESYVSETTYGPLVHARLMPGRENSGKLVTHVRDRALELAKERGAGFILIDGAPGTGCPVIATLSGVTMALLVVEPTVAGVQALERIIRVAEHFGVPCVTCVNKWDLNPEAARDIEKMAEEMGAPLVAQIPFDRAVIDAMLQGRPIVEVAAPVLRKAFEDLWQSLEEHLQAER